MVKTNTIGLRGLALLAAFLLLSGSEAFNTNQNVRLGRPSSAQFVPSLSYHSASQMNRQPSIQFQKMKLAVYNKESSSIDLTDDHDANPNKLLGIGKRTLASVAMIATLAILSYPSLSHAVDVSAIASGAAATKVDGIMASLAETGFYQAFSLVFVSEIGDKTFFMAGLLAMKTSKLISFVGSMGALFVMTLISVLIGQSFHAVPAGFGEGILGGLPLDDIAAVLAFAFFGIKTLQEALTMEEGQSVMDEELAEAKEEVDGSDTTKQNTIIARLLSIFGLVFAAEFGDRSFLSTIALSAAQNPISVAAGAIAAHAVATGIAVSGGAALAKYLSEKVIGIIGGTLFIIFAVTTAFGVF
jgi:putative Ca2+/H+ antiporter (TMEM165/GDT1 family)